MEALHTAAKAVIAWPKGIDDITRPENIHTAKWSRIVGQYERLGASGSLGSNYHGENVELVGIRKAVAIAGSFREILLLAREDGHLTKHELRIRGRGSFVAFDVAEIKRFFSAYHGRKSLRDTAIALGLPSYAVKKIVAVGLLPMNGISLTGQGRFVSAADYNAFVETLANKSSNGRAKKARSGFIPLRQASQLIGGRLKPWEVIFAALASGDMPFTLTAGKAPLVRRIRLNAKGVAKLRELAAQPWKPDQIRASATVLKVDALEILNVSGDTPVLVGLAFTPGCAKQYNLRAVLDRAEKSMTLPEIAQRTGWSISRSFREMERGKVPLLFTGCWCRESAEKRFPLARM